MDLNFQSNSDDLETKYNKLLSTLKKTNLIHSCNKEKNSDLVHVKKSFTSNNQEQARQILKNLKPFNPKETQQCDLKTSPISPSKHYYEILMKSNQDEQKLKALSNLHSLFEYAKNFLRDGSRTVLGSRNILTLGSCYYFLKIRRIHLS
jgi:hypothetical protein